MAAVDVVDVASSESEPVLFAGLDVLDLTAVLVGADSQNPGPQERAVADVVAHHAREAGFAVREVERTPGRPNLVVDVDAGGDQVLALSGHLDTKPVGDALGQWHTPPLQLTVVDGNAYGLGSSDMKGAMAAMLVAATAWSRTASSGRLRLVFTADEEAGSTHGAEALVAFDDVHADAMVVGEPSGTHHSWESMHTVSRGLCCFTVDIETVQGHSGLSAMLPESATVAAARAVLALHDLRPTYDVERAMGSSPTVNAGVRIEGGVTYGVHPGRARIACDIRLTPGMDPDVLDQEVRAVLAAALGEEVGWRVEYADGALRWMAAAGVAADEPVVRAAQEAAAAVLGRELPLTAYPGGTDASAFILRGGIPTVASLGPGLLSVAHGPNEYVPVADLGIAAALYERLATEYFRKQHPTGERAT